jgi:hypothetical protein
VLISRVTNGCSMELIGYVSVSAFSDALNVLKACKRSKHGLAVGVLDNVASFASPTISLGCNCRCVLVLMLPASPRL